MRQLVPSDVTVTAGSVRNVCQRTVRTVPTRAFIDECRNTVADRRLEPIVDDMNGAAAGRRRRRYRLRIRHPRNQGLFAQHVEARVQRTFNERRMAAWRRADIDEIKRLVAQQLVDGLRAIVRPGKPPERPCPAFATASVAATIRTSFMDCQPGKWPFAATFPKPIKRPVTPQPSVQPELTCDRTE